MSANSKIEWTTHTFNPWRGCAKVHAGCANCYAEREAKRFPANRGIWGPNGIRVRASDTMWKEPLKWNRQADCDCAAFGGQRDCDWCHDGCQRPRVFCASLADVFEDWQGPIHTHDGDELRKCPCGWQGTLPIILSSFAKRTNLFGCPRCDTDADTQMVTMADLRRDLFALIDATPNLDWLLLTKRPENVANMWPATHYEVPGSDRFHRHYRGNVFLGTSVSDQATYDTYAHNLYHHCRKLAPVLFISAEPLLGPIKLWHEFDGEKTRNWQGCFDWFITGGESGPNARACNIAWIDSIREQCQAAGVPVFVKQIGARAFDPEQWEEGNQFASHEQWVGKARSWLGGVSGGGLRYKPRENVVCVDATGKICKLGGDFQTAKYPVRWHDVIEHSDRKGGDWSEWPESLRVREFPEVAAHA